MTSCESAPMTHGGKREGAGRKPSPLSLIKVTVTLTPEQTETARQLGKGNVSAGVRLALEKVGG